MLRIVRATEPMHVEHPVLLLFGQPGIGKTSLAFSAKRPLLLDFDAGAHRAAHRGDTVPVTQWSDVKDLAATDLSGYDTIVVDTVGRCLDVMTAAIIAETPKLGPNGNLSQQGWGTLKTRFRQWIASLRALGKDVLLIAHDKEDRDGDSRIVRPDIVGGSFGEVFRVSDVVGYCYMSGRNRILDCNPTDKWLGKNPGGWQPFTIPPVAKAGTFVAELFDATRAALGQISDESAKVTQQVEEWRTALDGFTAPEDFTRAVAQIKPLPPMVAEPVKALLRARVKELGFVWNTGSNTFVVATAKTA